MEQALLLESIVEIKMFISFASIFIIIAVIVWLAKQICIAFKKISEVERKLELLDENVDSK